MLTASFTIARNELHSEVARVGSTAASAYVRLYIKSKVNNITVFGDVVFTF